MRPLPSAPNLPEELVRRLSAVAGDGTRYTNRLAMESSPYLQGHAHNPVNWYPWGDEAFADARRLDRPVFLSIGYSTCHWCHVMEEESFEDEDIAAFLNAHYIPIKVDREERPDVDAIYMRAAEQVAGSGGWPLSVWLTPEREPFFAGTYFPPRAGARGAEIGFLEILTRIVRFCHESPERVAESTRALTGAIRGMFEPRASVESRESGEPDLSLVRLAVAQCARAFDEEDGGLRVTQKFPSQVPIRLLLRHAARTGDAQALRMATKTLESMANGGIYDHLVGGFHRYATDPRWLVPHFEKMLYDNALLIPAYLEAWQVTKQDAFMRVARQTCDELLATFAAPDGGFFSALDADSEGEEGKYYVWDEREIRQVLGPGDDTELFLHHYGVTAHGNFEGRNILFERHGDEAVAARLGDARARLARVRSARVPPLRDEKLIAAWNGLAIGAFAMAGWIANEPRYLDAARAAADFVTRTMRLPDGGQLARSVRDGRLGGPGFLSDHAAVTAGLLDLFECTGEARWFDEAVRLSDEIERDFADRENGGWFSSGPQHERLLAREKPSYDGAEPSGASLALSNAARLATLTDDPRWRDIARRAYEYYRPLMQAQPLAMTSALVAVDFLAGPVSEIVVAAPGEDDAEPLVQVLRETFCPRKVLLAGVPTSAAWGHLEHTIPLLRGRTVQDHRATAYLCKSARCELPTTDPTELRRQLAAF
jgi:uncharacterized protein